jgi:hypothetical protein
MRRNAARIGYLLVCLVLIAAVCRRDAVYRRSEDRALERARAYAQTINYDFQTPERIYPYLCRDFRAQMSREAFCAAFAKERSYAWGRFPDNEHKRIKSLISTSTSTF